MRTPYLKLWIKNRDLSSLVSSFNYDRSKEKDDYAKIIFNPDYSMELIDDKDFVVGNSISFQYGFLGQPLSPIRICRISEIKGTYKEKVSLELKCLDSGNTMKKANDYILHSGTSKDIAESICNKYGLKLDIQKEWNFKKYKSLPQSFKSDFEVLRFLGKNEGFECYIQGDTLFFKAPDKSKKAVRTFSYGEDIHSLSIDFKAARKKRAASGVSNSTIDPNTKGLKSEIQRQSTIIKTEIAKNTSSIDGFVKQIREETDRLRQIDKEEGTTIKNFFQDSRERQAARFFQQNLKSNDGDAEKTIFEMSPYLQMSFGTSDLSKFSYSYGMNGELKRIYATERSYDQNNPLNSNGNSHGLDESENARKKILEAKLKIELDSSFNLGDIIFLSNVAKRHSGNWIIHEIQDEISSSGLSMTTLVLIRGSSNQDMTGVSGKNKSVNASAEGNRNNKSETILYNSNGERKGSIIESDETSVFNPVNNYR